MKSILKFSIILLIGVSLQACKTGQKITKATDSVEVNIPFNDSKYQTDKSYFRAVQSGTSPDISTAKKIALVNAKSELAGNIQTLVETVTDNYTNQRTFSNKQEFENKFEELSRQLTSQLLTNVIPVDEKMLKNSDGKYICWIAIEMSKDEVLRNLTNQISKESKLQIDFDKYQYEKIFNTEMEKFKSKR